MQPSLFEQRDKEYRDATIWKAKTDEWMKQNHEAVNFMYWKANKYASEGRRFSMQMLMDDARYEMRTKRTDKTFKLNHNMRAELSRRFLKMNPALKDYLTIRKSRQDLVRS